MAGRWGPPGRRQAHCRRSRRTPTGTAPGVGRAETEQATVEQLIDGPLHGSAQCPRAPFGDESRQQQGGEGSFLMFVEVAGDGRLGGFDFQGRRSNRTRRFRLDHWLDVAHEVYPLGVRADRPGGSEG